LLEVEVMVEELQERVGVGLPGEVEAEITGGLLKSRRLGNAAEAGEAEVVAYLTEEGSVTFRPHLIK
jgi:hypothetical protein